MVLVLGAAEARYMAAQAASPVPSGSMPERCWAATRRTVGPAGPTRGSGTAHHPWSVPGRRPILVAPVAL